MMKKDMSHCRATQPWTMCQACLPVVALPVCTKKKELLQKKPSTVAALHTVSCMLLCVHSQTLSLSLSVFLLFKEHVWVTSKGRSGTFDALLVEHPAQLTRDPFSPLDRYSIQMNWLCEMEHQIRSTWCGLQLNPAMQTLGSVNWIYTHRKDKSADIRRKHSRTSLSFKSF